MEPTIVNKFGQIPYEIAVWYQPNDINLLESVKPKYNIARKVYRRVQQVKYFRNKTNNFHAVLFNFRVVGTRYHHS